MSPPGTILVVNHAAQATDNDFDSVRAEGWLVVTASSAERAAIEITRLSPTITLVRDQLPDADGLEFISRFASHAPMILWTAAADSATTARALAAGAMDHYGCTNVHGDCLPGVIQRALHHWAVTQEHQRTTERLNAEQWRLTNIIEGTQIASWEWNVPTGETVFSESWATMLGYNLAELAPVNINTWLGFVHPEDAVESQRRLNLHFARESPNYDCECRMRHRRGHWIWVHDRGKVVRWSSDGSPKLMFGTHADITERKQAEARLRESLLMHRLVVQTAIDGFCILDITGRILEANDAYCRMLGYSSLEILQLRLSDLEATEEPTRVASHLREIKAKGSDRFVTRHRRRDGQFIDLDVSVQFLPQIGGVFVTFLRDITDRKRDETQGRKRQAELREAQQLARIGSWQTILDPLADRWVASTEVRQLLGYPLDQELPETWLLDRIASDELPAFHSQWAELLRGDEPSPWVHQFVNAGPVRWVQVRARVIRNVSTGEPIQVTGTLQDITTQITTARSLEINTTRLRRAEKVAGIGHFEFSFATTAITLSEGARAILHITTPDPTVDDLLDLLTVNERKRWKQALREVITGKEAVDLELKFHCPGTDEQRVVNVTAEYDRVHHKVFGVVHDRTEKHELISNLRESSYYLEKSQELAHIGSFKYDIIRDHWTASAHLEEIFGVDPSYPRQVQDWLNLVSPSYREELTAYLQDEVIGQRKRFDRDYPIIRPSDQAERWLRGTAELEFDEHGTPRSLIGTIQDITQERQAAQALQLQSNALDAAANAIVITDRHGTIEWANAAFSTVTGYSRSEAIGRNPRDLVRSTQHDAAFYENMWATITAGNVWHGEVVNRRKDRTTYTEDMTITPILSEAGEIIRFVAVKQEVTQRKALEAQLRHSQKMDAIGRLAGGVAHDFNNILAAVLLHLGLLAQEPNLDEETKASLHELTGEIKRGANLTRQLLTFSRKEAMQRGPVQLRDLILGIVKMIRRLVREDITIDVKVDDNLPTIYADAGMIEQVLVNLCINARDAMPNGGTLMLRAAPLELSSADLGHPDARPGTYVRISIIDTGEGISPEYLQRIFEPFFTTKAAGLGTGLGLSTAYGIMQQHAGWLAVDSAVGIGSSFHTYLPASPAQSLQPAPDAPVELASLVGRGETILLVEDEAGVRRSFAKTLDRNNYKVLTANDGREAVSVWQQHQAEINLLLTDVMMPNGVSGVDLINRCRQDRPTLPVIACSGYRKIAIKEDPNLIPLQKPFDSAVLLGSIRKLLDPP